MPYGLALALWQIATFLLYLVSIRAILAATPIGGSTNGENRAVPTLAFGLQVWEAFAASTQFT